MGRNEGMTSPSVTPKAEPVGCLWVFLLAAVCWALIIGVVLVVMA